MGIMSRHENSTEETCGQRKLNGSPNKQCVKAADDIEDTFDQSDEVANEKEFANKTYDKYTERFYNEGFREALFALQEQAAEGTISSNDETLLQASFDQGYASALHVALQLSTAKSAVESYLELSKRDKVTYSKGNTNEITDQAVSEPVSNERLIEIDKLNSDLDEAQTKLTDLIEYRNSSCATDLNADMTKRNHGYDNQNRVNEIDQMWKYKINELFDLQVLKERTATLLNINI